MAKILISIDIILIAIGSVFIALGFLALNYFIPYVIVGFPTRYIAYGEIGIGIGLVILAIILIVLSVKKG